MSTNLIRSIEPHEASRRLDEFAILDLRPEPEFQRGHARGAGNVPLGQLQARRAELPPREIPLLVVATNHAEAECGAIVLETMEFAHVRWLAAPASTLERGLADRGPAARLWRPVPFLAEVLPLLPRGRALDVAAGSGREAVFLAMHGFEVEAWDHAPEALDRARALAKRSGVTIETVVADLAAPSVPIPPDRYLLVTCFRFLHRPLFPALERSLAPGGHLVYETYRVGQERFGKPRRRQFLLEPGELRSAFPSLEVLRYEEPSPAAGPLTARLLARRRDDGFETAPTRS
jgi:SAM-dependent methyltransferase